MKWIGAIILLLLFIGLLFYGLIEPDLNKKKLDFKSEVFTVKEGFGYQIISGERILIRQDFIPAVPGKKPFSSAQDAKLVADLVMHKLSKGKSPMVSKVEIAHLNIKL
ncbi:MAG: DUF4907 domain-containing protein [Flavobacteriaceae bacterium]